MAFHFKRDKRNVLHLVLMGDIDLEITPDIKNQLTNQLEGTSGLMIDAGNVSYIDSSGVSILVIALQNCKKNRIPLQITAVSDNVMKVLKLAKLDKLLPIQKVTGPAQVADVDVFANVGEDAELTRDLSTSDVDAAPPPQADADLIAALSKGGAEEETAPETVEEKPPSDGFKPGTFS